MINTETFIIKPIDTLFFKDGRPMDAALYGYGANWPLPFVLYKAIRTALLMESRTDFSARKIIHHKKRSSVVKTKYVASDLFRSLRTIGPFPAKDTKIFLPIPADIVFGDKGTQTEIFLMNPMKEDIGIANFPFSWLRPVCSSVPPSKKTVPRWIDLEWFRQYLCGTKLTIPEIVEPFVSEHRIGIGIDEERLATMEGKIYSSEHMRLHPDYGIWLMASLNSADEKGYFDGVTLATLKGQCISLGGEGRLCRVHESNGNPFKQLEENFVSSSTKVKWTLITPACFSGGWLPNWICPHDGSVLLKAGDVERKEGEKRLEWRQRIREMPPIKAKLVAARVPKSQYASGWSVGVNDTGSTIGPKETRLFVPAGSVYYFEADSKQDADALVRALNGRTMSDFYGESGMGLGYCGKWEERN